MNKYIYARLRPLLVLPLFFLISASSYFSENKRGDFEGPVKDSTAVLVNEGTIIMPGETLSCNSFKNLDVVFWLPDNIQGKYGKVKFYLFVDGTEFKTRDFTQNDVQGQMADQRSWKLIAVTEEKRKHSDFDNTKTEHLDKFYTCTMHADEAYKGYKLKLVAKGYKQTGVDKKGSPKFLNQEVFAESEFYVSTDGQPMGKK